MNYRVLVRTSKGVEKSIIVQAPSTDVVHKGLAAKGMTVLNIEHEPPGQLTTPASPSESRSTSDSRKRIIAVSAVAAGAIIAVGCVVMLIMAMFGSTRPHPDTGSSPIAVTEPTSKDSATSQPANTAQTPTTTSTNGLDPIEDEAVMQQLGWQGVYIGINEYDANRLSLPGDFKPDDRLRSRGGMKIAKDREWVLGYETFDNKVSCIGVSFSGDGSHLIPRVIDVFEKTLGPKGRYTRVIGGIRHIGWDGTRYLVVMKIDEASNSLDIELRDKPAFKARVELRNKIYIDALRQAVGAPSKP
jgi:hypothetical protein